MKKIFLDTNVLLDVFAKREPFYNDAAQLWSLAENGKINASISAISFNNVYYIIRKAKGSDVADFSLRCLRDEFNVVDLTSQILNQAIDSKMRDFEDAIQYFSAGRADADFLITRNPEHFPRNDITVMTPDEFLAVHEG
ncbi:MAG: PIN domain-containing protein [Victivallales bacterium]